VNILFITLDQFRGDCLSAAGHRVVRTPNLDRLAAQGVRFARHYAQSAPCGPGRAALYTGTYQFNNRVVANGTPLDARFDNVALAARRAGFSPTLFGYTDQSVDPRTVPAGDERLSNYEGVLPGFATGLDMIASRQSQWIEWLREKGFDVPDEAEAAMEGERNRPHAFSVSAFQTDCLLEWIADQRAPWFAHASYLRPHPPYAAAGEFSKMYATVALPVSIAPAEGRHPFHDRLLKDRAMAAPREQGALAALKTQYFGMVSEVDFQLGRIWDTLVRLGQWDDTFIFVTADHGEQLGDHGLIQKGGYFEQSYHVPAIARDPRHPAAHGRTIGRFTEAVDVFPTLCEAMDRPVPVQCDGLPLSPFLCNEDPPHWRDAAHWEFDWRDVFILRGPHPWPWDRRLERAHLAVLRGERFAYVQFGDGSWRCFDLSRDPTWRTEVTDPALVLPLAQAMLTWRSQGAERTLTGMLAQDGGIGRWPPMPGRRD
jgi:arylsulfatase A-like enzyme